VGTAYQRSTERRGRRSPVPIRDGERPILQPALRQL